MNNLNQQLYVIYRNIQIFYSYRRLVSLDDELDQDAFVQRIQRDKYVLLSSVDQSVASDHEKLAAIKNLVSSLNETSDTRGITLTHILLIYPGTECETKRANMKKFINHVRFPSAKVLIVTPEGVSGSMANALQALREEKEHRSHDFKSFPYKLFKVVVPKHELAPQYEILSAEAVDQLRAHFINPDSLPKLFENDKQMVWIGATPGDVVKVTFPSEVTIEAIGYVKIVSSPV